MKAHVQHSILILVNLRFQLHPHLKFLSSKTTSQVLLSHFVLNAIQMELLLYTHHGHIPRIQIQIIHQHHVPYGRQEALMIKRCNILQQQVHLQLNIQLINSSQVKPTVAL
jgi:hypothetical protein